MNHCAYERQSKPRNIEVKGLYGRWDVQLHATVDGGREYWWVENANGIDGEEGYCPAKKVDVKDTTGAGDAFFAGAVIGQTYGKTMMESCEIGTRLAASVITTGENVCPRYLPSEFGLDVSALDDAQLALEL